MMYYGCVSTKSQVMYGLLMNNFTTHNFHLFHVSLTFLYFSPCAPLLSLHCVMCDYRCEVKESDSDTIIMVIILVAGVGGVFILFALMALCYRYV